jgi:hypothetical protein
MGRASQLFEKRFGRLIFAGNHPKRLIFGGEPSEAAYLRGEPYEAAYLRGGTIRSGLSSGGTIRSGLSSWGPYRSGLSSRGPYRSGLSSRPPRPADFTGPARNRLAAMVKRATGLPSGIVKPGKKYQPRIFYSASASTQGHKGGPRGIGSFDQLEDAIAALGDAQRKFDEGGEAAVWHKPPAVRAPKSMVLPL